MHAKEIGFFDEESDPVFLRGPESHLIEQTEEEIEEANYLDSFIHLPKDSVKTSKNPSGHHLSQKSQEPLKSMQKPNVASSVFQSPPAPLPNQRDSQEQNRQIDDTLRMDAPEFDYDQGS